MVTKSEKSVFERYCNLEITLDFSVIDLKISNFCLFVKTNNRQGYLEAVFNEGSVLQ
jgi:hypothetical protein